MARGLVASPREGWRARAAPKIGVWPKRSVPSGVSSMAGLQPTPIDDGRSASPERIARSIRAPASADSELTIVKEILQHALLKTGIQKDPEPMAIDLQERLQQVNINTALQLCHALELAGPAVLEFADLRTVIKGPLVVALQDTCKAVMSDLAKKAPKPKGGRGKLRMEIFRVDLTQLSSISQKDQTFNASLFVQACLPGGNKDVTLKKTDEGFPLDTYGRPTFHPSAAWYLTQVEFQVTPRPVSTRLSSVATQGEDLMLNKRVDGAFFDEFAGLGRFPFDCQHLSMAFVVTCANEGPLPVELALSPKLAVGLVKQEDFSARAMWTIGEEVSLKLTTVGASATRRFPALRIGVWVERKPFFYLVNVAMPSSLFSLLAVLLMLLPINYPPARLTYQLTLTLTVITYKVSLSNLLPAITDLTVLDKHQLLCFFIILAIVFETALLGSVMDCELVGYCTPPTIIIADRVSQGVAGFMWLCVHVWFVRVAWFEHYSPKHKTALEEQDLKAGRKGVKREVINRLSVRRNSMGAAAAAAVAAVNPRRDSPSSPGSSFTRGNNWKSAPAAAPTASLTPRSAAHAAAAAYEDGKPAWRKWASRGMSSVSDSSSPASSFTRRRTGRDTSESAPAAGAAKGAAPAAAPAPAGSPLVARPTAPTPAPTEVRV